MARSRFRRAPVPPRRCSALSRGLSRTKEALFAMWLATKWGRIRTRAGSGRSRTAAACFRCGRRTGANCPTAHRRRHVHPGASVDRWRRRPVPDPGPRMPDPKVGCPNSPPVWAEDRPGSPSHGSSHATESDVIKAAVRRRMAARGNAIATAMALAAQPRPASHHALRARRRALRRNSRAA